MEKESFYEKLKKAKPYVKEYFDTKKIVDMTEFGYVREKCPESKGYTGTRKVDNSEAKDSNQVHKIISIILGIAVIWGIGCVISGVITALDTAGDFGTLDIVLGVAIVIGSVLLFIHFNKKKKEVMHAYQEKKDEIDAYNKQIEGAKAEYRAISDSLNAKYEIMKNKISELGLRSTIDYIWGYEAFNAMLKYAKEHPNQTTPSTYIQKVKREEKAANERLYRNSQSSYNYNYISQEDNYSFKDALAEDREARFRHDEEMRRKEESRQNSLRWQEERKAWDEKKKQEARERTEHRAQVWQDIKERSAQEKNLRHQCNTCSLSSKCYMRGSYPCPTYRPR